LGQLYQAQALIAVHHGRWQEGFALFAEVAQGAAEVDARWYQANTILKWAQAHLARGETADRQRARELLEKCRELFSAMQNPFYLGRVQALMAGL
jgi:hypothetical protein